MKKLYNFSAPVFSAECCDILVLYGVKDEKVAVGEITRGSAGSSL